jgi:hypothetical protein
VLALVIHDADADALIRRVEYVAAVTFGVHQRFVGEFDGAVERDVFRAGDEARCIEPLRECPVGRRSVAEKVVHGHVVAVLQRAGAQRTAVGERREPGVRAGLIDQINHLVFFGGDAAGRRSRSG